MQETFVSWTDVVGLEKVDSVCNGPGQFRERIAFAQYNVNGLIARRHCRCVSALPEPDLRTWQVSETFGREKHYHARNFYL